jgi:hypothetical protein
LILKVTAVDLDQLLGVKPNSYATSFGDGSPDGDGSLHVSVADLGPTGGDVATISETTAGLLARVTFETIGVGVSSLGVSEAAIVDTRNDAHAVGEKIGARITSGSGCG